MNKVFIVLGLLFGFLSLSGQNQAIFAPDSAKNYPRPGATGSYTITNPLNHNGTQFGNPPITMNCTFNCVANDLFLYDLGISLPSSAVITGVEVIHSRGACNSGSYMIDSIFLGFLGAPLGQAKRDSASISMTDTLGSPNDGWGAGLTPAMVNDPQFGLIIRSTGTGICTYAPWNVQLILHYDCAPGQALGLIPDSVQNIPRPGANGSYSLTNPLTHNGNQFDNPPTTVMCAVNCVADHLYFKDFGFSIPSGAQITGVVIQKTSGACNQGSFMTDTLQLAYQGNVIGQVKRDSSGLFYTSIFGATNDVWGAALTPAMVNDPSFGVFVTSTSQGVCTYLQTDLRMDVHYCLTPMSITEPEEILDFQVFPNPASDHVTLTHYGQQFSTYTLHDMHGRLVHQGNLAPEKTTFSVRHFPVGFYVLTMEGSSIQVAKVWIQGSH